MDFPQEVETNPGRLLALNTRSGTHALALILLKANGIEPGGATTHELHVVEETRKGRFNPDLAREIAYLLLLWIKLRSRLGWSILEFTRFVQNLIMERLNLWALLCPRTLDPPDYG